MAQAVDRAKAVAEDIRRRSGRQTPSFEDVIEILDAALTLPGPGKPVENPPEAEKTAEVVPEAEKPE